MEDKDEFSVVGSVIGLLLFVHRLSKQAKRTTYAHICIEIDMDWEYPEAIPVVLDQRRVKAMGFKNDC